jgi:hypothetical protein
MVEPYNGKFRVRKAGDVRQDVSEFGWSRTPVRAAYLSTVAVLLRDLCGHHSALPAR